MRAWLHGTIRQYAEFDGRIGRRDYAIFWLLRRIIIATANLTAATGPHGFKLDNPNELLLFVVLSVAGIPFTIPGLLAFLVLVPPALGTAIRRLRDAGLQAAWVILPLALFTVSFFATAMMAVVGAFFGREVDNDAMCLFLAMCMALPASIALLTLLLYGLILGAKSENRDAPVPSRQTG